MEIKELLKHFRHESGLTQREVAGIIGYSTSGYANWEQGYANPPNEIRAVLAELFEIEDLFLIYPERYEPPNPKLQTKLKSELFHIRVTKEELAFILDFRSDVKRR